MDFGWRFQFGHADDPAKDFDFGRDQGTYGKAGSGTAAAAMLDFDDSGWMAVNVPHDWATELPFVSNRSPLPPQKEGPRAGHGFKPLGREFPETSIGWYRREFDVPASDFGRLLSLEFDGVFRDALVMINGYIVKRNESGYAPFRVDISDFVNYGGKNILTVRVDATLGEGWFYEGAGIYRHVWLVKTDSLHVPQWGAFVRSNPSGELAELVISTELSNAGNAPRECLIASTILDPHGYTIATLKTQQLFLGSYEARTVEQRATLNFPMLWSLEAPQLYQLVTQIVSGGKVVDCVVTSFGIRTVRFDAQRGFFLNDSPVKILGTCNHQDHAGVGVAVPDRLQAWRIEKLKEMGSNAYRTSHNPPASELLDACDRLGMLVLDETRRMSSDPESLEPIRKEVESGESVVILLWVLIRERSTRCGNPSTGGRRAGEVFVIPATWRTMNGRWPRR